MSHYVFFFKQKTAYEMRISDWSSDVCSSDLAPKTAIKEQPKRTPASEQATKPKYDFYTLLPESEVILPPEAKQPEPPVKPVTPEEAAKIDEIGRASCRERVGQYV